jgi:GWxTD domain-containing protein
VAEWSRPARQRSHQQSPQQQVSATCDSALVLLASSDFEGATRLFERALDIDPRSATALIGMGRVTLAVEEGGRKALRYFKPATEYHPDNAEAHYYRGLAHARRATTTIWGRFEARSALRAFERAIELEPAHPDAYYRKGLVLLHIYKDIESEQEFRRQIEVDADHLDSWQRLLEIYMDNGAWERAVWAGRSLTTRAPGRAEAYSYLAGAYWKLRRLVDAMETFDRYLPMLPTEEMSLYYDLGLVLTPSEQAEFSGLDREGRLSYWRHYWSQRDPDLKTVVNERLLEHYIRVAYARLEFSEKEWPWDIRGALYVRYGEPDLRIDKTMALAGGLILDDWAYRLNRQDLIEELGLAPPLGPGSGSNPARDAMRQGGMDIATGSGRPEDWYYTGRGIHIRFEDPVMSGIYQVGARYLPLVTALELHVPTLSPEENRYETFRPLESAATFRGEGGRTALEYAIGVNRIDIGSLADPTGETSWLDARMELFSTDWRPVADARYEVQRLPSTPQINIQGKSLFVHGARLEVEPGEYILSTLLKNPESGKRAASDERVSLPDYSGDHLMVSDIMPAARIRETGSGLRGTFIRQNLDVLPLPGRRLQTNQTLFIYYEIYNLTRDAIGATDYRVDYSVSEAPYEGELLGKIYHELTALIGLEKRRAVLTSGVEGSGIFPEVGTWLEIDMGNQEAGTYILELVVSDLHTGATATTNLLFTTVPPR